MFTKLRDTASEYKVGMPVLVAGLLGYAFGGAGPVKLAITAVTAFAVAWAVRLGIAMKFPNAEVNR